MPNNDPAEIRAFLDALNAQADADDADQEIDDEEIDRRLSISTDLYQHLEGVQDEVTDERAEIISGMPVPAAEAPRLAGIDDFTSWTTIGHLPGYVSSGVRALGRPIFRNFPCFVDFEDGARRLGQDALSQVHAIGFSNGDDATAIRTVVEWIRDHGDVVNSAEVSFGRHIPGYKPTLTLALSDENTFLLVRESVETGAPRDAHYVYAWPGGKRVYSADIDASAALVRMGIEGHSVEFVRVAVDADQDMAIAEGPQEVPAQDVCEQQEQIPEIVRDSMPLAAPATKSNVTPIATLRSAGFDLVPSEEGAVLSGSCDDGCLLVVTGADQKSVALASLFNVKQMSASGEVLAEFTDLSAADVIEKIENSSPRP